MRPWMEKFGSVLLIVACALVILFSALYTRQDDLRRLAAQNAAASQDETLSEAVARYTAPVPGDITHGYQGAYKSEAGIWHFDPFVRYTIQKGDRIAAVCNGQIVLCNKSEIIISGESDFVFRLKGAFSPLVTSGDFITVGQEIALATTPGELQLSLSINGHYTNPLEIFTP